ncbi:MAG: tRNA pseudouridine synthase D [Phycisphaeraceae bacterium]|nr:MAG: tRNA pseudouridine synthase D [Phycisphaeraceae bacterium]
MTTPGVPIPDGAPADTGMNVVAPRYLTADVQGIGGVLKQRQEDFLVDEIPLYHPTGEGEHIYLLAEKRGMSTVEMIGVLARHFRVNRRQIGHAGLKDKHAITRQIVSIHVPGKTPDDFPMLEHPSVTIHWADLHQNKLKRGHLAGNRFSIRVRGVTPQSVIHARKSLEMLASSGVPNRIGIQRFGYLHNNHLVGRAIIMGEQRTGLDLMLGPNERSPASQRLSRELYAEGNYRDAFESWPRVYRAERQALHALADGASPEVAFSEIDPTAASFFISSFQSAIFNAVLNKRVEAGTLSELLPGDVAFVHKSRACFLVDAADAASRETRERMDAYEISPSGPMWGSETMRGTGESYRVELEELTRTGVTLADLDRASSLSLEMLEGDRRPLRIPVRDVDVEGGMDEHGPFVRCAFELPRGSFATTVLDEIMKINPLDANQNG